MYGDYTIINYLSQFDIKILYILYNIKDIILKI